MRRREMLVIVMVASGVAILGETLQSPYGVADELEPTKLLVVNIAGIELQGRLEQPAKVGEEPVLLLRAKNTLKSPVTLPLALALRSTNPLEMMSRALPLSPPTPLWSKKKPLTLNPGEERKIRIVIPYPLKANANASLGLEYRITAEKKPEIELANELRFRQEGETLLRFNIAPQKK